MCLVQGVTESFLPGAVVAISSFLKQHPRFAGGIVLFYDGLPRELRAALERALPPLRFEPVSPALRERLARLGAAHPNLGSRLSQFYSLETFRVGGYRKVLYCDCDLLFRRPIDELFETEDALLCCGDLQSLSGRCRDAATYRPIEDPCHAGPQGALERTFNSGLMLVDARLMGERTYAELLASVSPETWRSNETPHTDQFILNRYFTGRQTLVSPTYNYNMSNARVIRKREGLTPGEASVLHFTGPVKPWMPKAMLRWTKDTAPYPPHPALASWYEAWMEWLARDHLEDTTRRWRKERGSAG